jgi:hypothetical protein
MNELGRLESPRSISGTKSPKQFTHPTSPLKRLWHQHWFEPSFLGKNLANDLKSPEAKKILEELCSAINQGRVWDQHLYDIIIGGYQRRCCAGKMTGEWIVFAKIESMNYYLTLALHSEPDEMIFERIKDCISKFPEIRSSIEHGEWDDPGAEMGIP